MHPNTEFIIDWTARMMKKTDFCGAIFPEALACFMDEADQENPSDAAVEKARQWEDDMSEFLEYIASAKNKWCNSPMRGCLCHCEMWRLNSLIHNKETQEES